MNSTLPLENETTSPICFSFSMDPGLVAASPRQKEGRESPDVLLSVLEEELEM